MLNILKRLSLTAQECNALKATGDRPTVLRVKLDERKRLRLKFASQFPVLSQWCLTTERAMVKNYFDFEIIDENGRVSSLDVQVDDNFMKHELGSYVYSQQPLSGSGLFAQGRNQLNIRNTPMGRMFSQYSSDSEYGMGERLQFAAPWAFYQEGKEVLWMDIVAELSAGELPQSSQFSIRRHSAVI
ncbi:MAG: hypothetical protein ACI3YD_07235 [Alloprevotella sp.]